MSRVRGGAARPSFRAAPRQRPPGPRMGRPGIRPRPAGRISLPYGRLRHRRRPYGRHWHWGRGVPWPYWADNYPIEAHPIEDIGEPRWSGGSPAGPPEGPPGLSPDARASLSRLGLLRGNWLRRLATAGPELSRFINRFHDVAGARHVIEEYFAGRYQRAVAPMSIRLSERLATRDPDFRRGLHFDRRISFAPDGQPILTVVVGHRGLHYRLFPWRRLNRSALERQLRRDRLAFGSPARVRWLFDRRLMPVSMNRLAADMRQMLGDRAVPNQLIGLL